MIPPVITMAAVSPVTQKTATLPLRLLRPKVSPAAARLRLNNDISPSCHELWLPQLSLIVI
jgi:hypothetical protein